MKELLCTALERKTGKSGWQVEGIDMKAMVATLTLTEQVVSTATLPDRFDVALDKGTGPGDGEKVTALMADMYPEHTLVRFEPLRGEATLARMTPQEQRAREALAVAMGVKPWDVQVKSREEGGYGITLPSSYVPSKHDARLEEAATTAIGEPGWYVQIDPKTLTGIVAAGAIPTFPNVAPYPMDAFAEPKRGTKEHLKWQMRIPLGISMKHGPHDHQTVFADLAGDVGGMCVGTPGSGKSVQINAAIAGALIRHWEVGIIDVPHKEGDFRWVKPYVKPGFYGACSKRGNVAVMEKVYAMRDERKRLLDEWKVDKWNDLPADVRPAPFLLVVDEATGLFSVPKPAFKPPKDAPEEIVAVYEEQMEDYMAAAKMNLTLQKILLELRFVGIRVLLATQQAQTNTGITTTMKMAMSAFRILQGVRADKRARIHAFSNPDGAPDIPANIVADQGMGRGVAVAEIEGGDTPFVIFKGYYADSRTYEAMFADRGLPTTGSPEPESWELTKHWPSMSGEAADEGPAPSRLASEGGFGAAVEPAETRLRGAAAAAHALKENREQAGKPLP